MEQNENFIEQLYNAVLEKSAWFDKSVLPEILDSYRMLHTCVSNLISALEKKSLIHPDPYKKDKKIVGIEIPEDSDFNENERPHVLGERLSLYEGVLDFVCNYVRFSTATLSLAQLKKLSALSGVFLWQNLTANSHNTNTRALAHSINIVKQNGDALTNSLVFDCLSKAGIAIAVINSGLKSLSDFQREMYKMQVRKTVMTCPAFESAEKPDGKTAYALIHKLFRDGMGDTPFYSDLVQEIVDEDYAGDMLRRRADLLGRLRIEQNAAIKKRKNVDTRALVMEVVELFTAFPPTLDTIVQKVRENHDVLVNEKKSLWARLRRALRQAFNLAEPAVFYPVSLIDPVTGISSIEKLEYSKFVSLLAYRSRYYASVSAKGSQAYNKIFELPESEIADFLVQQVNECNRVYIRLDALDDYFKNVVRPENRSKIKGLKIELTVYKNSMAKINQRRMEYLSFIEELEQMKKLGIIADE